MKSSIGIAFALLLTVAPLQAQVTDHYSGAIDVADQSEAERQRAMPEALAQVLGKLSGLPTFEDRPEVLLALEQAPSLAVTYYFRNRSVMLSDGTSENRLQLVVNFAREATDNLVRALQLPVWEPERRPLTVWLVVDDDQGRRILPIELEFAWQEMARVGSDRGLPILRPQPDAEGNYAVDIQLLWGGYTEELTSQGPADTLVAAALREGPEWSLRLNLDYAGQRWSWRERGIDLPLLLTSGMHRAIDEIAASSSISAADLGRWTQDIAVSGITSTRDYARCLRYLQGLSVVEDVGVLSAIPGTLELRLELNALPDHLQRLLQQDGVLAAAPAGPGGYVLVSDAPPPEDGFGPEPGNGEPVDEPGTHTEGDDGMAGGAADTGDADPAASARAATDSAEAGSGGTSRATAAPEGAEHE